MRHLLIVLVLVGCKGDKKTEPAPQPTPGTASAAAGSAPGSATTAPPANCDVAGDYRLRFASNGSEGWWWRFKVTDPSKAELVAPVPVLGIDKPGPLSLEVDTATCTLVVTASHGSIGDMTATVKLDNATGKVAGELVRAKPRDEGEKAPHPMVGMRDVPNAPTAPPGACIAPGTYKLTFDPKAKYKSDSKREKCDINMLDAVTMRFEWLGTELYADAIGDKGVEKWAGMVKVTSAKMCDVELEYADGEANINVKGKLTFAGGNVTGTASEATYAIIEDGEAGENMWNCSGKNVAITGAKT